MLDIKGYSSSNIVTSRFVFFIIYFYFVLIIVIIYLGPSKAALWMCSIIKGQKCSVIQIKTSLPESDLVRVRRSDPQPTTYIHRMCEHCRSVHDAERHIGCHVCRGKLESAVSMVEMWRRRRGSHTSRLFVSWSMKWFAKLTARSTSYTLSGWRRQRVPDMSSREM